jgi:hypothetical protein
VLRFKSPYGRGTSVLESRPVLISNQDCGGALFFKSSQRLFEPWYGKKPVAKDSPTAQPAGAIGV